MRHRLIISAILVAVIVPLFGTAPAHAAMEYYTYGGFHPVTSAFQNIALMFADNSYKGALLCFGMLGLFWGAMSAFMKIAGGSSAGWFMPLLSILFGLMVYAAGFARTDTLYVYDPVYNQTAAIANLPVGVVYPAGIVNTIERYIVNLFDTNSSVPPLTSCGDTLPQLNYQDNGGAIGTRALVASASSYVQGDYASQTVIKYTKDCVSFEIGRPGSTLTMDRLINPPCGTSFLEVLAGGQNPANYSVSFLDNPPAGTVKTCTDIYNDIKAFYTNASNANPSVSNACGGTSFEDMARCQQILSDSIQDSLGIAMTPQVFVSNNTVANITAQTLITQGGASQAQYLTMLNQAQSGSSGGFMAGIMNPLMIDAYVAYAILLFPILAMFLPTPLWQKAAGLMLSLIVWTTLLRALDVITFHMWVTQYQQATAAAINGGFGLDATMRLPAQANKYLGSFASMRNSVFLLATAVSGALFKFGDSAMSRLADKASLQNAAIKDQIADRGIAANDAKAIEANAGRAMMLTALAEGSHLANMGRGLAAEEIERGASGMGKLDTYGGSAGAMMEGQRHVAGVQTSQHSGYANGMSLSQSSEKGATEAASVTSTLRALGMYGKNAVNQAAENAYISTMSNTASGIATKDMVEGWADKTGLNKADAYKGFAAMDMANRKAVMEAWHGDVGAYTEFLEGSQHLSMGERDAVLMATAEAGLDLRDFAKNRAVIDKMKDVGMIKEIQEGRISTEDLKEMGRTGILGDAGRVDSFHALRQMTGMDARQLVSFLKSHEDLKSVAGYQEAEAFAQGRGKTFLDLVHAGARSFRMDLSAQEAKSWGLKNGGTYMLAADSNGNLVFQDEKSGHSFQRGTFGRSGTQVIEYDEHGKQQGHWKLTNNTDRTMDGKSHDTNNTRTISDGVHVDTVSRDGTHNQGVGVTNPRTHKFEMTDGKHSKIITDQQVENTGGGMAVVTRLGDRFERTVAVSANGSKHVDLTQEYRFGNAGAVNVGNINAAFSSKGWSDGQSLDPGDAAKISSIAGRSVDVAATKVGQVFTLGRSVSGGNPSVANPTTSGVPGNMGQQMRDWKEYFTRTGDITPQ